MLETRGLSTGYGPSTVLHDVSITVPDGKLVVVIGPNGHGKSTLLRAISGLLVARTGSVHWDGQDVTGQPPQALVRAGIVHIPQGDLLFPDMTVEENLMMGAYTAGAWKQRGARLGSVIELFPRLGERRRQHARTLSGGERRMLALGRGLMADAKLLMIDEPSLGLAPVLVDEVYGKLREIRERGLTVLLIEENFSHVTDMADHVYLLESGRIVRDGPVSALLDDPALMSTYLGV
ncbi:MAG: ABC transporter ATP-binding protein [Chloroflexota bacterium]